MAGLGGLAGSHTTMTDSVIICSDKPESQVSDPDKVSLYTQGWVGWGGVAEIYRDGQS